MTLEDLQSRLDQLNFDFFWREEWRFWWVQSRNKAFSPWTSGYIPADDLPSAMRAAREYLEGFERKNGVITRALSSTAQVHFPQTETGRLREPQTGDLSNRSTDQT